MNISELEVIGVQIAADALGNLRIKAPARLLTPQLLGAIDSAKPALVSELRGELVNFVNFDSRVLGPGPVKRRPESEVHRAWLLRLIDHEPLEVHFTPVASHAKILASYPYALAAEPFVAVTEQWAAPITGDQEAAIVGWLAEIGEADQAIIDDVLTKCRHNDEARAYYRGRAGYAATDNLDD